MLVLSVFSFHLEEFFPHVFDCVQGVWYREAWCLMLQKNDVHNFILKILCLNVYSSEGLWLWWLCQYFLTLNKNSNMKCDLSQPPHMLFELKSPRMTYFNIKLLDFCWTSSGFFLDSQAFCECLNILVHSLFVMYFLVLHFYLYLLIVQLTGLAF